MNVKTYQTKSLQEALDNIKRDLGSEALILSTREVLPSRGFGFLRKPKWEVAAAAPRPAATQAAATAVALKPEAPKDKTTKRRSVLGLSDVVSKPMPKAEPLNLEAEIARRSISPDRRIDLLLEEMDDLKKSVRSLGRAMPAKGALANDLYIELTSHGIDGALADRLIAEASEIDPSPAEIRNVARRLLAEKILIEAPAELQAKSRIVSVFVGPTGVGKTTTIAKIAGQAAARYHKKVSLITTDLLRVGSQDQLSRFGSLLNVPAYTCSDLSTLTSLIQSLDDQDLILVDTPGASPTDLARLARLEEVLKMPEARVNLVIGATTRSVDIDHILTRFKGFAPQRIILTKIDETDSRSAVVGDLLRNEVGITFLTNGQRVPEDLLIPSASEMARWVLPVD